MMIALIRFFWWFFQWWDCLILAVIMRRWRQRKILKMRIQKTVKTTTMIMKWKMKKFGAGTVFFVRNLTSVGRGSSMTHCACAITHPAFLLFPPHPHLLHSHIIIAKVFSLSFSFSVFYFIILFFWMEILLLHPKIKWWEHHCDEMSPSFTFMWFLLIKFMLRSIMNVKVWNITSSCSKNT